MQKSLSVKCLSLKDNLATLNECQVYITDKYWHAK